MTSFLYLDPNSRLSVKAPCLARRGASLPHSPETLGLFLTLTKPLCSHLGNGDSDSVYAAGM